MNELTNKKRNLWIAALIFYLVELITIYLPSIYLMSGATCQPGQTCPVGLLIPIAGPIIAILGLPALLFFLATKHKIRYVFLAITILHFLWTAPVMLMMHLAQ